MKKLLKWLDENTLKYLVGFLIAFIVLYPKLPSIGITHTWVYVRLEDFLIGITVIVWLIQVVRRKVSFPLPLGWAIVLYWGIGLISLLYCLIFIAPGLANFFPTVAVLEYLRRIEYMILFFVGFTTIKSLKDVRDYIIILGATLFGVVLYGLGQRNYVYLWHLFPSFFEKNPFCFPAFLTGNEEFAKGLPFCLADTSRVASTFGGHYDLAAYLVFVIPIFIGVFVVIKKWYVRILSFLIVLGSLVLLNYTSSRTSYVAYLIGAVAALIFWKKKWWIIPVCILSIGVLFAFKGDTLARLLKTIQPVNVVTVSPNKELPNDLQKIIKKTKETQENQTPESPPPGTITLSSPASKQTNQSQTVTSVLTDKELSELNVEGSISTRSGAFLVQKAYALDISFTTRFQAEWPRDFNAYLRYPVLGMGYSSLTLASDNDYLRALGETGTLGFVTFFLIFIVLGIYLKHTGKQTSTLTQALIFGIAGGTIGLLANALLIDVYEASKVGESFWLLTGIGVGAIAIQTRVKIDYLNELRKIFTSSFFIMVYLLIGIFVFFGNILTNFFVADDFTWLKWAATATFNDISKYFINAQGFFYRPIDKTLMFFMYTFFSFQPVGYHLVNLLLIFGSAVGLYFVSLRIFKTKVYSVMASSIFLLLPMHFENVFWISTISNNLVGLFIIWGVWSYLRFRESRSIFYYLGVLVFTILALFSYEQAVVFPLFILIVDILLLNRKIKKIDLLFYAPLFILDGVYFLLRSFSHVAPVGGDYSYSIQHLIPNLIGNLLGYLSLFVFGSSALPWYNLLRVNAKPFSIVIILGSIIIGILAVILLLKKRSIIRCLQYPLIWFVFSWIVIGLLPFLALGNISARYAYVSSMGYAILLGILFKLFAEKVKNLYPYAKRTLPLVLFIILIIAFAFQNNFENNQWQMASATTRKTFLFFLEEHPTLTPNTQLIFINVPIRKNDTWIFPVGLSDAMWFIYHDDTIKIYQVASLKKALILQSTIMKPEKPTIIFSFNHDGTISEIKTK
ncbi:MAG TPA: O-antigen ligase family protein [Patescibacteria group bacterium]